MPARGSRTAACWPHGGRVLNVTAAGRHARRGARARLRRDRPDRLAGRLLPARHRLARARQRRLMAVRGERAASARRRATIERAARRCAPAAWWPSRPRPSTAWARIATDDRAVAAIFAAKRRPRFNPLIVHVASRGAARALARWSDLAERLAARFWPGALTLVLPRAAGCPLSPAGQRGRAPRSACAGRPIRSPGRCSRRARCRSRRRAPIRPAGSARPPPSTSPKAWATQVDLILDGGPCPIGVESTVLDLTGRGAPPAAAGRRDPRRRSRPSSGRWRSGAGRGRGRRCAARASSPATTRRRRPLRLDARSVAADEALLAFGPAPLAGAALTLNLSPRGRSGRGGGQPLRDAARARPAGGPRDRGDADPGRRARRGDPRPAGARGRLSAAARCRSGEPARSQPNKARKSCWLSLDRTH